MSGRPGAHYGGHVQIWIDEGNTFSYKKLKFFSSNWEKQRDRCEAAHSKTEL